jgi:hypothetical protein
LAQHHGRSIIGVALTLAWHWQGFDFTEGFEAPKVQANRADLLII